MVHLLPSTPAKPIALNETKYTSNPSPSNQTKLQTAEQNIQIAASDAKHNYENNLINQFSTNRNSSIYKYLSLLTNYSSFPTTMHYNYCSSASTDHDQANLFKEYFFSVFTRDSSSTLNTVLDSPPNSNILDNITISPHDVYDALTALDPNKAQGIDHISPKVWKISAPALYYPVYHLFAKCIANSTLPAEWQTHTIKPIFKSGDRSAVNNYRPISLLCIVSKVLERLVYDKTLPFLLKQLTVFQFGFLPNRSAIQQLLTVANTVQEALTANRSVDVIYLDFKKTFDSVLHNKLLSKLWSLGIRGNLWNWFKAYLGSRQQCERINDSLSRMVPVLSGVPQGSILGPLLFAVFNNDLQYHCMSHWPCYLYSLMTLNVLRLYQILPTLFPYKMHSTKHLTGAILMTYFSMNLSFSTFILVRILVHITLP